ncbi:MAG: MFS transporter [Erysipelotrichaceae bacterium]|nr:MFS transporter [Erysipelotrichaceae bacterium]
MDEQKRLKKNLWMFPLGTVGRDMVYNLVTNFLLTYILFTKGLTAAQLGAITAIMVAARVFDALNDPIMGNIIEITHTRWGKFKPWLLIGILLTSAVVVMVFATDLKGWSFVWLFGIFYFCYSIAYTMHDISYWGMVPALSSDASARDQITSRATLFAGIGGTLASIVIPMLTTGNNALGGSANVAYKIVAIVISILAPLFLCFTLLGASERREQAKSSKASGGLKKTLTTLVNNDQLRWIAVIFLIQQIGNGLVIGGIGSTYIYFEYGYEGGLYSLFTTVGMSATAFLMIFYPAISKRIKRKKLMNIMAVISIVGYVLMGASRAADSLGFTLLVIGYMLSNFGQYCYYLIMMISIINTVEYNELKTGSRDEAIIASVRPFMTKMASALIVLITTGSYVVFGVTNYTNQISDFESAAASGLITEAEKLSSIQKVLSSVESSQSLGLLLCMVLIPCALMLISNRLYQKHYTLDEEEYERICKEIEQKKTGESL